MFEYPDQAGGNRLPRMKICIPANLACWPPVCPRCLSRGVAPQRCAPATMSSVGSSHVMRHNKSSLLWTASCQVTAVWKLTWVCDRKATCCAQIPQIAGAPDFGRQLRQVILFVLLFSFLLFFNWNFFFINCIPVMVAPLPMPSRSSQIILNSETGHVAMTEATVGGTKRA